jgi:molybdopterin converting factor small subunit
MLIEKSKSEDFISLGDLDITSNLVENLLKELQKNEKIKGIFYNDKGEIKFYTITGIKKLMLENSHLFSFHDFFYGKELNSNEIELLRAVFNNLLAEKKLKGSFDEETLTFSSHDVLFAEDYNSVLSDFDKIVKNYNQNFNNEFQKIKKILTKRNENIFPQEIKAVQEAIDRINEKYIRWRNGLESFVRNANVQLLKKQGYNMKRYRSIQFSADKKENIKLFEEDPEVRDLLNEFNSWIKLFNEIEMKYENIIFYQKRLMKDPDIKENQEKFNDLLNQLNLN